MHAVAESGIAAHWMYKGKHDDQQGQEAQRLGAMWLQSLMDIQHDTRDSGEFLEHVRIDLFPDAVYVFTPKSKILALPRGATPVDFAYAIHSDVGDHCVACRVNGEPVALRTELHSGDVVEVISAPNARPNPAWLNFVRTGRARSRIRHYLKTMEQEESQELGVKMLAQALRAEGPDAARRRCRRLAGAVAAADPLDRQPQPRRTADRHRARPQDRDDRRQATGRPADRARRQARCGDADDWAAMRPTTACRRRRWS